MNIFGIHIPFTQIDNASKTLPKELKPRKSIHRNKFPASQFKGLPGSGFDKRTIKA